MTPSERLISRLTLASLAACVTSVGLYAIHRWVQAAWISPPDPAATIVSSTHAGYFWRVWTVSYAGVMVGFLAFAAARAHEARVARGLVVALSVSVALLVAQGIFVP